MVTLCKVSGKGELGHKPIRVSRQQDLLHGLSCQRSELGSGHVRVWGLRSLPFTVSKSCNVCPKDCCGPSGEHCEHGFQLVAGLFCVRNAAWSIRTVVASPSRSRMPITSRLRRHEGHKPQLTLHAKMCDGAGSSMRMGESCEHICSY